MAQGPLPAAAKHESATAAFGMFRMRHTPLLMIAVALVLTLAGTALAAKDHETKDAKHHAPARADEAPEHAPHAHADPAPPHTAKAARAPLAPSPAPSVPRPAYVLHAGFVSLDPPPIGNAIANVGTTLPASPLAVWHWALPLVGLAGLGAVIVTARGLQGTADADPRSHLHAGKAAIDRGDISEGLARFTQATRLDPDIDVAHYCRGLCLAALRQHEEAYAAFSRAYDLDAAEGAYRLEFARAAARTERAHEAMDALGPLLVALPSLAEDVAQDEAFAALADHPRFLAMTGRL